MATYRDEVAQLPGPPMPRHHDLSHGESFLAVAESWIRQRRFFVLDELESALSLAGQLALVQIVLEGVAAGRQFVIATHSPIMMSTPGALVYEVDDLGIHQREAADPDVVLQWRSFAQCTERFLRFLER